MPETKDQIAAERDELRAENERLRRQLGGDAAGRPAEVIPFLSEGDRQQLIQDGQAVIGGRTVTLDEARGLFPEVDLPDEPAAPASARPPAPRAVTPQPGVTHVYPSVAPGVIDPKLLGTPGIHQAPRLPEKDDASTESDAAENLED